LDFCGRISTNSVQLRTHTLQQPYLDSDMASRWYDFGGDTIVRTDSYVDLLSVLQPDQRPKTNLKKIQVHPFNVRPTFAKWMAILAGTSNCHELGNRSRVQDSWTEPTIR
jgi:hypothetical protein